MGTRADFYVGRGKSAEWIGSIAWDGYPEGIPQPLLMTKTEEVFRGLVTDFFKGREDATLPEMGWPWPWENSHLTDFAYAFDGDKVWASCFGGGWFDPLLPREDEPDGKAKVEFPDMTERQRTTLGKRSGLIILGG